MTAAGMAARDGDSRRIRRRQLVLFSVIAAAVLVVFAFWLAAGGGKAPAPTARIDAELVGPGTAEESWTRRSEARLGTIETRLREMEAENRRMGQENARLQGELRANAEDPPGRVADLVPVARERLPARIGPQRKPQCEASEEGLLAQELGHAVAGALRGLGLNAGGHHAASRAGSTGVTK